MNSLTLLSHKSNVGPEYTELVSGACVLWLCAEPPPASCPSAALMSTIVKEHYCPSAAYVSPLSGSLFWSCVGLDPGLCSLFIESILIAFSDHIGSCLEFLCFFTRVHSFRHLFQILLHSFVRAAHFLTLVRCYCLVTTCVS